MAATNYVKFLRGSLASYNKLATKDNNTLYFVYENADDTYGSLYLGDKLISSNVGTQTSLGTLTDVILNEVSTGDFLVVDSSGQWKNVPLSEVVNMIVTNSDILFNIDEAQFNFTGVNNELSLLGFNNAAAGMVPVKSELNSLEWTQLPPDLTSEIADLNTELTQIKSDLAEVDSKILNANHLKYEVISDLSEAVKDNTIYLYPNDTTTGSNRYDEFMLVNGSLENLGNFAPDLSQYATVAQLNNKVDIVDFNNAISNLNSSLDNYVLTTTFQAVVGDLSQLMEYHNLGSDASISDIASDIYDRLVWHDIQE